MPPPEAESVVNAVEGEIRDFVRRDVANFRRPAIQSDLNGEAAGENLASLDSAGIGGLDSRGRASHRRAIGGAGYPA